MELLSINTLILWLLAFVGFIVIFLGVTLLSMKLSRRLQDSSAENSGHESVELLAPDDNHYEGQDRIAKVVCEEVVDSEGGEQQHGRDSDALKDVLHEK